MKKAEGDEPIHPAFFQTVPKSEIEFRLGESAYFLDQMLVHQGSLRRAQEQKKPLKMVKLRQIFTYYFSAFLSSTHGVRELMRKEFHGDDAKKPWFKSKTETRLCQFFGLLREMNSHRRILSAGMSHKMKWVNGQTQIDLAVVYGQKSSNPYMSPLYLSVDVNALDARALKAYKDLEAIEGQVFSVTGAAKKHLDELYAIWQDGVSLGYFP